jgi:hypothetical protein
VSAHPDLRRLDDLPESERKTALAHLGVCSACRRAAVAEDPTRVFSILAARQVPEEVLERVSRGVAAVLRGDPGAPSLAFRPRRARIVSAWAAAAALAAALLLPLASRSPLPEGRDNGTASLARAPMPRPEPSGAPRTGEPEMVNLAVGDTEIMMIFDPRIDL